MDDIGYELDRRFDRGSAAQRPAREFRSGVKIGAGGAVQQMLFDGAALVEAQRIVDVPAQLRFAVTALHASYPNARSCFANSRRPLLMRDLTVPFRDCERSRDFTILHFLNVAEYDGLAQIGRQSRQRGLQQVGRFARAQGTVGPAVASRTLLQHGDLVFKRIDDPVFFVLAVVVDQQVARQAHQPRSKTPGLRVEGVQAAKTRMKTSWVQVAGGFGLTGEAVARRVNQAGMLAHEAFPGAVVSAEALDHPLGIAIHALPYRFYRCRRIRSLRRVAP